MSSPRDHEILEARERGTRPEDLPQDGRDVIARYQRLEDELRGLDASPPPDDWEAAVHERLHARAERRRRAWRLALPLAATIAGVSLATWLVLVPAGSETVAITRLAVLVEDTATTTTRSGGARVGDSLIIQGVIEAPRAEIRVYRNDLELIFRCGATHACEGASDRPEARVSMLRRGRYQAVLLVSAQPLPEPRGTLDEDLAAAMEGGAETELAQIVEVR